MWAGRGGVGAGLVLPHVVGGGLHRLGEILASRPVAGWANYKTPLDGLVMCGSATHPGGGIMGAPGRNAALAVLKGGKV